MAALNEILDDQSAYYAQDALDELYQAGALTNVDLPTFRQSFRDALAQQGALDDNQIDTVVDAVSNEIETNGANPVDFVTPAQEGPPRYPHEASGLYYDEAGNWYNPDGTPSAYTWNADYSMFYDASGNWYNADLTSYTPPETPEESQLDGAEEAISELIDEVLKQLPEAANLPPEEFAKLLAQTLEQP
jgi:hypothetical protein